MKVVVKGHPKQNKTNKTRKDQSPFKGSRFAMA